jgi:hypothetical protein
VYLLFFLTRTDEAFKFLNKCSIQIQFCHIIYTNALPWGQ